MELDEPIPCHVCRMLLNGRDQYDDHLKGKRHRKNKRKQRRQGLAVPGSDDNDHAPRDKAIKLDKTGCLAGPSDAEQKDLGERLPSTDPFQLWRKMLTAALHFLVASGQPTAHVTRPAFSMPAVSLPLMSHALLSACQRSAYRSRHTPCV